MPCCIYLHAVFKKEKNGIQRALVVASCAALCEEHLANIWVTWLYDIDVGTKDQGPHSQVSMQHHLCLIFATIMFLFTREYVIG